MKSNAIITKLEYYKDKNEVIHISIGNGIFYNGRIIILDDKKDFVVILDNKLGEVPVLFEEILKVEPYRSG